MGRRGSYALSGGARGLGGIPANLDGRPPAALGWAGFTFFRRAAVYPSANHAHLVERILDTERPSNTWTFCDDNRQWPAPRRVVRADRESSGR